MRLILKTICLAVLFSGVCFAGLSCQRDADGNLTFKQSSSDVSENSAYFCTKCEYKYNPMFGDPAGKVPEHTPFKKLPYDWKCPNCGASKKDFEIMR